MDDGMDTGGFDDFSTPEGNGEDAVDILENNVEIEIPADGIEISAPDNEIAVGVEKDSSVSVHISDTTGYEARDVEDDAGAVDLDNMIDNLHGVINGIKEHDEGTEAEKSEAIRANVNETMKNIGLSDMSPEEKVDAMQTVYAGLPEGARDNIYVPSDVRFLDPEAPFDEDGFPRYQWEGNMGFEGKPEACQLSPGQIVDRYGSESGAYVCEVKDGIPEDYDARALPYEENPDMYHQYEIVRDMDDFKSQIENLTVEEIEQIEMQRDLDKPEGERRSPEQIKEDAADRYTAIIYDAENTSLKMYDAASKNGWQNAYKEAELVPMKGSVKEAFSYVDENGETHKRGGGEQICLPASVDTLVYLGYMKEKK